MISHKSVRFHKWIFYSAHTLYLMNVHLNQTMSSLTLEFCSIYLQIQVLCLHQCTSLKAHKRDSDIRFFLFLLHFFFLASSQRRTWMKLECAMHLCKAISICCEIAELPCGRPSAAKAVRKPQLKNKIKTSTVRMLGGMEYER